VPSVLFLFLRRMRAPLIVLVVAYAVAIAGLVLMPGVEIDGQPQRMGFFHAFYVVSYTATTIGFGELPHPFSDAQRLWMTASIYLTVVAWFYAIGRLIALFQDPAVQRALAGASFRRGVRGIAEPFVLVVGYGETGRRLVEALDRVGHRAVVVDRDAERLAELDLADLRQDVPALVADAGRPQTLADAGLALKRCAAVAAITSEESINLSVAIAAKLAQPKLQVFARCATQATAANLESFGTDFVFNPLEHFAHTLELALASPSVYLLSDWLIAVPGSVPREPLRPPRGRWIVCGFGRFGQALVAVLERNGCDSVAIDPDPAAAARHPRGVVADGTGTEILEQAGIRDAVAIVAGTPNDSHNLSIVMTARALNPALFTVVRVNRDYYAPLVERLAPSLTLDQSELTARLAFVVLTMPLLARFLQRALPHGEAWANELIARLAGVTGELVPEEWLVTVTPVGAPAAWQAAADGQLRVAHLLASPRDRVARIDAVPLLLVRDDRDEILPGDDTRVEPGDQLLFAGSDAARGAMRLTANNINVLRYVIEGELAQGTLWRWLESRRAAG
jgi:Trk K+ transport system NAD-binding subunit